MTSLKMRKHLFLKLIALLAGVLSNYAPCLADSPQRDMTAASILLDHFESVFYSRAGLVSGSLPDNLIQKQDIDYLTVPFANLRLGLDALGKGTSTAILQGAQGVLVGARDFRPPTGLGLVQSQFCFVVNLKEQSRVEPLHYLPIKPSGSTPQTATWNWPAKLGEEDPVPTVLYAVLISRSYFLVSNSPGDLEATASLLSAAKENPQTAPQLRDRESIMQHEFWGYRKYRHSGIVDQAAAGMMDVAPSAEALAFFVDIENKSGVLRLITSVRDDATAAKLNARRGVPLPPLKPSGPGVWETKVPLGKGEDTTNGLFVVMGLFGFGTYL